MAFRTMNADTNGDNDVAKMHDEEKETHSQRERTQDTMFFNADTGRNDATEVHNDVIGL